MKIYLLDGAGAGILILFPFAFFLFLAIWGLLEGLVLYFYKFNSFGRVFWNAVVLNLVSLVVGFLIMLAGDNTGNDDWVTVGPDAESARAWVVYFVSTVLVEALLLKAIYRAAKWGRVLGATLLMNLISYLLLFLFVLYAY